ncbi:MAG: conjugal transfer protein TraF [Vibrio sp.]
MKKISLSVGFSLVLTSPVALSANYAIEARGDAMGGVGVVSGNFLTGPFYNPALVAIYRRNDDVGMILPSIGLSYNDPNDLISDLDTVSSIIEQSSKGDFSNIDQLNQSLNAMQGDVLNAELGGVIAFAIPNQFISANVFGKAYTESFVSSNIDNRVCSDDLCELERAKASSVNAVSVGVTELGITLAKYQTFLGQHIAFGVTPKLQRVYTYVYEASLNSYDIKDLRDNGTGETIFNMDAGALWFFGPIRIGFAATNLISREIKTQTITSVSEGPISYSYDMKPLYTVGAGIVADYFTLSVDYDLNEEEGYKDFKDNTQMIRVGGEIDIMRQLKLRAGYNKNLAYNNTDGTITGGIGLSPLNLFQLDIGASYTNDNAMGAYVNFLASY